MKLKLIFCVPFSQCRLLVHYLDCVVLHILTLSQEMARLMSFTKGEKINTLHFLSVVKLIGRTGLGKIRDL